MYRMITRSLSLIALILMVGCDSGSPNKPPKVTSDSSVAQQFHEDSIRNEALVVESLRKWFGDAPNVVVAKNTGKPAAWNDILCDQYLALDNIQYGIERASPANWAEAGVSQVRAESVYQDSAIAFAGQITKLVVLSENKRYMLDNTWSHTCDGLLHPTEIGSLVDKMTHYLIDSKSPRPAVTPSLRNVLLKYYNEEYARLDSLDRGPEVSRIPSEAEYWGLQVGKMVLPNKQY
ncbi:MAG: hypothetical protein KBC06_02545 [Candidatus Pacebacteria bacterium]|nr:hypothetical protein [Candidatus Paceibacterota bacterium]